MRIDPARSHAHTTNASRRRAVWVQPSLAQSRHVLTLLCLNRVYHIAWHVSSTYVERRRLEPVERGPRTGVSARPGPRWISWAYDEAQGQYTATGFGSAPGDADVPAHANRPAASEPRLPQPADSPLAGAPLERASTRSSPSRSVREASRVIGGNRRHRWTMHVVY